MFEQPDLEERRGHPEKILELIDRFGCTRHFLVNVGQFKGKIVTDLIAEVKPQIMVELGGYCGYSTILFGDAVRKAGGKRYISLEANPLFAAVANMMVELAGLRDIVTVIVGRSDLSLQKLHSSGEVSQIGLVFLDHYKPAYLTDLMLCEELGLVAPDTVLAADNVISPGNPPYLEYVRSSVSEKKKRGSRLIEEYETAGFAPGVVNTYSTRHEKPVPAMGNSSLIYQSQLVESYEPHGEKVNPRLWPL